MSQELVCLLPTRLCLEDPRFKRIPGSSYDINEAMYTAWASWATSTMEFMVEINADERKLRIPPVVETPEHKIKAQIGN